MTVEQLFDARLLIEPEVIRLILKKIDHDQVALLHRLAHQARTETDPEVKRDLNIEFHHQLGIISGNAFYTLFIDSSLDFVRRFLGVITPKVLDIHDDTSHGEIVRAIEDKDEIKAVTLMRTHLLSIRDRMIEREGEYLAKQSAQG